jgi:hypothetical protein
MKNCQGMSQTKAASLSELLAFLKSLMSKGKFSPNLLDSIFGKMSGIVGSKYASGANGSNMRSIVDAYLPSVAAQAAAEARAGSGASSVFGSGNGANGAKLAGLVNGSTGTGSFFDSTRTDPYTAVGAIAASPTPSVGGISQTVGGVAIGGLAVTSDEIRDYFNGRIPQDDDSFAILLWLGVGKNPMLMLEALSYAKRLHNDVVLPCASYYKQIIYGDANYPTRLGQIRYGIIPETTVTRNLRGSASSRHLLGQAVNFSINSVSDAKVVEDLEQGRITAYYGTLALTSGIHASLPFYAANDAIVRRMTLWSDSGIPNFVGYRFK